MKNNGNEKPEQNTNTHTPEELKYFCAHFPHSRTHSQSLTH